MWVLLLLHLLSNNPVAGVCQPPAGRQTELGRVPDAVTVHQAVVEIEQGTNHHGEVKAVFVPTSVKNGVRIGLDHAGRSLGQLFHVSKDRLQLVINRTAVHIIKQALQQIFIDTEGFGSHLVCVEAVDAGIRAGGKRPD